MSIPPVGADAFDPETLRLKQPRPQTAVPTTEPEPLFGFMDMAKPLVWSGRPPSGAAPASPPKLSDRQLDGLLADLGSLGGTRSSITLRDMLKPGSSATSPGPASPMPKFTPPPKPTFAPIAEGPQLGPGITEEKMANMPIQPRFGMGAETGRQPIGGSMGDKISQALTAARGGSPQPNAPADHVAEMLAQYEARAQHMDRMGHHGDAAALRAEGRKVAVEMRHQMAVTDNIETENAARRRALETPPEVADAREAFQKGTISRVDRDREIALAKMRPQVQRVLGDFPDHFLEPEYGGTPIGALESLVAHGHGSVLSDPVMGPLVRRYMRHLYGSQLMSDDMQSPLLSRDDEKTAQFRTFLAGQPYGESGAGQAAPTFVVPPTPQIAWTRADRYGAGAGSRRPRSWSEIYGAGQVAGQRQR
jgi:hypothetical protein